MVTHQSGRTPGLALRRNPMIATPLFARLAILATAVLLTGCTTPPGGPKPAGEADPSGDAAAAELLDYYAEETREGRIYVLGDAGTHIAFLRETDIPHSVMKVDAGPAGEAVILQADPARPSLSDRLWAEFQKRSLYYAEEEEGGKIFVVGSLMAHLDVLRERAFAQSETAEIDGKTVVFEVNPEDPRVLKRLKAEYTRRHAAPAPAPGS
jgi:hypothetical protein